MEVWGQYYKEGAYQISHYHSHSDWAFVYYVNTPQGSSPLVFDKSEKEVYSEAGEVVIFPGWLRHYSDPHAGKEDRWSMSFNSLPHGAVNAGPQGVPMARINVL